MEPRQAVGTGEVHTGEAASAEPKAASQRIAPPFHVKHHSTNWFATPRAATQPPGRPHSDDRVASGARVSRSGAGGRAGLDAGFDTPRAATQPAGRRQPGDRVASGAR